ncbi:MAG: hypothetical protein EOP09_11690 [Proteobacteria bacterium]|nr:MAG: hypothetical protein EOP09_11690 [Pseudomonadota bacterium]
MIKQTISLFVFAFALNTFAYSQDGQFPQGPDAALTPGELCQRADSYRYPEKVAYCERDVSSDTKRGLFVKYDQLGFRTREMNRGSFKIDHYIPLCMGGSNSEKNLWPQHVTIYNVTDPLEPLLCEKMAAGRLTQKKAVEYIMYGKAHLNEVSKIISEVNRL